MPATPLYLPAELPSLVVMNMKIEYYRLDLEREKTPCMHA